MTKKTKNYGGKATRRGMKNIGLKDEDGDQQGIKNNDGITINRYG